MRKLQNITLVVLAAASLGGLARASVVIPLTLDEMSDRAERIFVGTCSSKESYWEDRKIWTDVTFRVDRHLKGRSAREITLHQLGGSVSEPAPVAMRVAGATEFTVGEKSLVFLRRRKDGTETVLGFSQGHLPLVQDTKSGEWRSRDGRTLQELVDQVQSRLKGSAQR